jgi:hypothetical protein
MRIDRLSLLIIRLTAATGFGLSLILVGFVLRLSSSMGESEAMMHILTTSLYGVSLTVPIALWLSAPRVVRHLFPETSHPTSTTVEYRHVLSLLVQIVSLSLIAHGIVELELSLLSRSALETISSPVIMMSSSSGGDLGSSALAHLATGLLLLVLSTAIANQLTKGDQFS